MKLVYINSGIGSVFQAQVLALLDYYASLNVFDQITLLCGVKNDTELDKAMGILKNKPFQIQYFKQYPNYSFYNFSSKRSVFNALQEAQIADNKNTVFHIRGELTAYFSYDAIQRSGFSSDKIIVDLRGASLEEFYEFQRKIPLLSKLKLHNIKKGLANLHKAGVVSTVSNSLKNYLLQLPVKHPRNVTIAHCFASKSFVYDENLRKQIRKQLSLGDETKLFVFSTAGTAGWQNNKVIGELAAKGFKVLNLSPAIINHPNVINRFVPYEHVPAFLCSADIAIIIRNNSMVNKVASPVKFSEYVCCGLPVLTNNAVDSISQYASQSGNAAIIEQIADISDSLIDKLCSISRTAISESAKNIFGIETIAGKYIKLYTKMNKS